MMKQGELTIITDTVKDAVKFYTEKLAFDVVEIEINRENGDPQLVAASLRKGKSFIKFRTPSVEELAEFSFIKRCASRCVGFSVPLKKGIERYYARCNKKGVKISQELSTTEALGMSQSFVIRDPFGTRILVYEPASLTTSQIVKKVNELGLSSIPKSGLSEEETNQTLGILKRLGVLRRAGKKYLKLLAKAKI